jgi:hypothetical protein
MTAAINLQAQPTPVIWVSSGPVLVKITDEEKNLITDEDGNIIRPN